MQDTTYLSTFSQKQNPHEYFDALINSQLDLNHQLQYVQTRIDTLRFRLAALNEKVNVKRETYDSCVASIAGTSTSNCVDRQQDNSLRSYDQGGKGIKSGDAWTRKEWYKRQSRLKDLRKKLDTLREYEADVINKLANLNDRLVAMTNFWKLRTKLLLGSTTKSHDFHPQFERLSYEWNGKAASMQDLPFQSPPLSAKALCQIRKTATVRHCCIVPKHKDFCVATLLEALQPMPPQDAISHIYAHEIFESHNLQQRGKAPENHRKFAVPIQPRFHPTSEAKNSSTLCSQNLSSDSYQFSELGASHIDPFNSALQTRSRGRKSSSSCLEVTDAEVFDLIDCNEPDGRVKQRFAQLKNENASLRLRKSYSSSALDALVNSF